MESREANTPQTRPAPERIAPEAFAGRVGTPRRTEVDLHICPTCAAELVHPIDWAPAEQGSWVVELRCPSCEWMGGGTYTQEIVDRFEELLDAGTDAILADLTALARANMEEEIERFAIALETDLVLPEDF